MVEMDDQTANQAANPLKKREKKKKSHQFWNSKIAVLKLF
jgi:hypothetical protein